MALHLPIVPLKKKTQLFVGAGTEMRTQYHTTPLADDTATTAGNVFASYANRLIEIYPAGIYARILYGM